MGQIILPLGRILLELLEESWGLLKALGWGRGQCQGPAWCCRVPGRTLPAAGLTGNRFVNTRCKFPLPAKPTDAAGHPASAFPQYLVKNARHSCPSWTTSSSSTRVEKPKPQAPGQWSERLSTDSPHALWHLGHMTHRRGRLQMGSMAFPRSSPNPEHLLGAF